MLKLFLLIPFITLNVAATLGLIYFTLFINPGVGSLVGFVLVIVLLSLLVTVNFNESLEKES